MKILIVKLSSIGDVVHTLPSLCALRSAYPTAEIDWLVEEEARDIIKGNAMINNAVVVKRRGFLKDPGRTWRIARGLKARGYDIVIDFQGLFKSGIWVYFSGARRRIGFDKGREFSNIFLNDKINPYDPDKHAVDRYLQLARYAGGKVEEVRFPFTFSEGEKERVSGLLKEGDIKKDEGFVILSPGARWETKLWGAKRFAELAEEINKRVGLKVVLVGSEADRGLLHEIASRANSVINLGGRTTLKELTFLMKRSLLVISVDSGPMHIASAVGTPVVALFGPTAPWRTGPYGSNHIIFRRVLDCSPCFSRRCGDNICMKEITVNEVMDGVIAIITGKLKFAATSGKSKKEEIAVGCDSRA
jgi:lipopolysaccharide heptosyltransferase I